MTTGKPILIKGTLVSGVDGGTRKVCQVLLPDTSDIVTLKKSFTAQLGVDVHICYKGTKCEEGSLEAAGLLPTPDRQIPHVYLCKHGDSMPKSSSSEAPKAPASVKKTTAPPQPAPQQTRLPEPQAPDPIDPVCRLCFGDEETSETGKLFSPCLCKGTMKYIHIECLNKWRWRSQNSHSYYKCDQCQYQYNVTRASWAHHLLDERLTRIVAVVGLILMTASLGIIFEELSSEIATKTWEVLAFHPLHFIGTKICTSEACDVICNTWNFWNWEVNCVQNSCRCSISNSETQEYLTRVLSNGLVSTALLGVFLRYERFNCISSLLMLLAYFFSGGHSGRIIIFFGVIHSFDYLNQSAHERAKYFMTRFGENILNVT